jgi:hypothetical protein
MRRLAAWLRPVGMIALAAALLLWPAVLNGRPAVFTDTALYVSEAEYLMQALGVVAPGHGLLPADDPTRLPDRPGAPNLSADIDGGRSPVWGAFFYLLQRGGGLWLVAYVQALAAAAAVYALYRAAAPARRRAGYLALMAGLAVLTSLPVFATLAMPDLFAGVAAVCLLTLMAYWDRLRGRARVGVSGLLTLSLMAHGSDPLLATGMAVAGATLLVLTRLRLFEAVVRAGVVLLAVGLAMVGTRLVYAPIQARAGEAIRSPPFLSARVLADGPGRAVLRRVCGQTSPAAQAMPFALCRFAQLPLNNSDDILWSHRAAKGVFSRTDPATRHRLAHEDLRFALTVAEHDPLDQAGASLRNAAEQLVEQGVGDSFASQRVFVVDGFWRRTSLPRIVPDAAACLPRGACAPRLPPLALSVVDDAAMVLALLFVAWRLSRSDLRAAWKRGEVEDDRRRTIRLVLLAVLALLINAGICGALSGPFDRYQARLAWIVPMAAGLLLVRFGPAVACRCGHVNYTTISMT